MKSEKSKIISTIALAILLITSTLVIIIPSATAQVIPEIKPPYTTFAYISANPNPIGVEQTALVTFRVDQPAAGAVAASGHFNGTSVTITRPDNTTEVKENLAMDATSSGWFLYTPTQVGTYYFQMHFPEQSYWLNQSSFFGGYSETHYTYLADDSEKIPLVVQQDPVEGYSRSPPLPTGYWTRPINAENKGWWQAGDNWLMKGYDTTGRSFAGSPAFAPYTSGPQSAHILWKKPIIPGGIVGGKLGDTSYYTGISYEQHFDAMILQGTIFYAEHGLTSSSTFGTRFIDLYTGQDYPMMYMNNTNVAFAQTVNIDNPNEHGVLSYLVVTSGSDWEFYEILPDMQGEPRLRFTLTGMNGLTGYTTFGPQGEILSFNFGGNATHRYLYMFNSTRAILGLSYGFIETWGPSGTINASRRLDQSPGPAPEGLEAAEAKSHSPFMGIEWNVTVPDVPGVTQNERLVNYDEGWLLATATDSSGYPYVYSDVGYNIGMIKKDASGAYPAMISHTFAANRTVIHDIHDRVSNNLLDGVYVRYDEGEEVYYCYDMQTGQLKWSSTPLNNAWALFTRDYQLAYGKMVTSGFDGIVRGWDLETGDIVWEYSKGSAGFENAYGTYPEYAGFAIADRTVYCTADEHSSDGVLWRGANLWAINIDSGELVWKANGMYRHPIVSDGIMVALNSYDGSVYAYGRGPSKTTVTTSPKVVSQGTTVLIEGTVTDQTPASKDTPAISDESMGMWMEYLHMQKVIPDNATGVPVSLTAINCASGEFFDIGTTTSDMAGNFGIPWNPGATGTYQIIASFEGSESYGGSFGTTYLEVGTAPAASPTVPPTPTPPPTTTVPPTTAPPTESVPPTVSPPSEPTGGEMYIIAAVAVVIIVAAAAAAIILRRRK